MIEATCHRYFKVYFLLIICVANVIAEDNELKMVHVIFRHGERTPSSVASGERYPKDPYLNETFFPLGPGGLTNDGKISMYELGAFLRQRYDEFLGDLYYPGLARIRSTDRERTRMSAQLVSAGLWPPSQTQQWNKNLLWMPIPYEYVPSNEDSLMFSYKCPTYRAEYQRVLQSDEVQKLVEPHLEFFAYLSEHTGLNITEPKHVFFLYHTLDSQRNSGLELPSWTEDYFPDGEMYNVTLLEYEISSWGELLAQIYGGPLILDILRGYGRLFNDTSSEESNPKITLYSGHESNISSILKALGVWYPHIPDFSSAVIFELYSNSSTDEYGVQILYYLGKSGNTIPLTIPGCTQVCPINEFVRLLSKVIPDDVEELCHGEVESGAKPPL